jgi:hypothetical protein
LKQVRDRFETGFGRVKNRFSRWFEKTGSEAIYNRFIMGRFVTG